MSITDERCLDDHDEGTCRGTVEFRSVDGRGSAWPRCDFHFEKRLERRENSMEMYANSDVAPSWFDPSVAGERWDDEY